MKNYIQHLSRIVLLVLMMALSRLIMTQPEHFVVVHANDEPSICARPDFEDAENAAIVQCANYSEELSFPLNHVCYAHPNINVRYPDDIYRASYGLNENIFEVLSVTTLPFNIESVVAETGLEWGVAVFRLQGDLQGDEDNAITLISYGGMQVAPLVSAVEGVIQLDFAPVMLSQLQSEAVVNCNSIPSGYILGVQEGRSASIIINDVLLDLQSIAYISFETPSEMQILKIEGNIAVTLPESDDPNLAGREHLLEDIGDFVRILYNADGEIIRTYTDILEPSALDRLSLDPYSLFFAFNSVQVPPDSRLILDRSQFGIFHGFGVDATSILTYATVSNVDDDTIFSTESIAATNGGLNVVESKETETNGFVNQVYFRAGPEDGDIRVQVSCPNFNPTLELDCVLGGLEYVTIAIFDADRGFVKSGSGERSVTTEPFTTITEQIYTVLISGTGRAPRGYVYCIDTAISPCPADIPGQDEPIDINFPPEFVIVEPQNVIVGEETRVDLEVFDPEGVDPNNTFNYAVNTSNDDLIQATVVQENNQPVLLLNNLQANALAAPVFVYVTATDSLGARSTISLSVTVNGCSAQGAFTYVAQPGDTYFNIIQRIANFTLQDLYTSNCINDPEGADRLIVGDVLYLPQILGPLIPTDTDIVVNTSSMAVANDGFCSLVEAINSANSGTRSGSVVGECDPAVIPAIPTVADTIRLDALGPYILSAPYAGDTGLPQITSTVVINGNGNTVQRVSNSQFRILQIGGSGNLTLNNIIISGGDVRFGGANGGGIQNFGTLTLNGTVSGNAGVDGGGISNLNNGFVIINGNVTNNFADVNGGGILNRGTMIVNGNISSNSAFGSGGGISNSSSHTITVNGATFNGNTNGAIFNAGIVTITSATFNNNNSGGAPASLIVNSGAGNASLSNIVIGSNSGINCSGGGFSVGTGNVGGDGTCF